jgi:hypothetical protein
MPCALERRSSTSIELRARFYSILSQKHGRSTPSSSILRHGRLLCSSAQLERSTATPAACCRSGSPCDRRPSCLWGLQGPWLDLARACPVARRARTARALQVGKRSECSCARASSALQRWRAGRTLGRIASAQTQRACAARGARRQSKYAAPQLTQHRLPPVPTTPSSTPPDRSYEDLFKEEIARRGLNGGSVTSSREEAGARV